jgi:MerR family transcriptional regulator, heat shock protein HspR
MTTRPTSPRCSAGTCTGLGLAPVTAPWTEPGRGLFSISVAAELAGLHPQTLRIYEREGLIDPARSPGGTRRYSTSDLTRLQEITTLMSSGLNLAGVRRVLELQAETQRLHAEIERLKTYYQHPRDPEDRSDST